MYDHRNGCLPLMYFVRRRFMIAWRSIRISDKTLFKSTSVTYLLLCLLKNFHVVTNYQFQIEIARWRSLDDGGKDKISVTQGFQGGIIEIAMIDPPTKFLPLFPIHRILFYFEYFENSQTFVRIINMWNILRQVNQTMGISSMIPIRSLKSLLIRGRQYMKGVTHSSQVRSRIRTRANGEPLVPSTHVCT